MSELALLGGGQVVEAQFTDEINHWPKVNDAMESSVLKVLRDGNMSGTDISKEFGKRYAEWIGVEYGLPFSSGTASIQTAMFAIGLGCGDEIISPSTTYWATCLPALSLGARVVFADIDPVSLCLDPKDIERKITERTKAIVVVHYLGYPADMDAIMAIVRKYDLKVIEDVSHAHGALYKGEMTGSIGDVGCFSLMSGKGFAVGEAGIFTTNDRDIFDRGLLFAHYGRHGEIANEKLRKISGLPLGGCKYRMHQMSAAVGLEQLKKFPAEMADIDKAMSYFWELLEGVPGLDAHRPEEDSGSTKGAWYAPHGIYKAEELSGLSVKRFCDAVAAEGGIASPGCNKALHTHPIFSTIDIYGAGKPTQLAHMPDGVDVTQEDLPVTDTLQERTFGIPWFKHFDKKIIEDQAAAFRKVVENHEELLAGDSKEAVSVTAWGLTARKG